MVAIMTPEILAAKVAELKPLPAIAARIMNMTASEDSSASDLATVIQADQALSVVILKLANSAYFGSQRQIATVDKAVILLGFSEVRNLALASSVIDLTKTTPNFDYAEFWRFSVVVGLLSEVLARGHPSARNESYAAGILHSIGRLALAQTAPKLMATAIAEAARLKVSVSDALRSVMGFTDGELGGALARQWNLPETLCEAIESHEGAAAKIVHQDSVAGIVARAREFARAHGLSDSVDAPQIAEPAPEWGQPPVALSLQRVGGIDGVRKRADSFMASIAA